MSSVSVSVVLSSVYREVLGSGLPSSVCVVGGGGGAGAVGRFFSSLDWGGVDVSHRVVGGVPEWFSVLGGLGCDVVDVTPGRKVHALAVYSQAVRLGVAVRYSYLVDESRFGYRYPGYAPPWAVKLLEIYPGLREIRYSLPEELRGGSWEGEVPAAALHALINTARVVSDELAITSKKLRLRASLGKEPFEVVEAGGDYVSNCLGYASFPVNIEEVVEGVSSCVRRGCAVALDTSALMYGLNQFLAGRVRGYASHVAHLEPVMSEATAFLEMKHSPEGLLRELAYLDALAAGQAPTPSAARRGRGGDAEIIKALKELRAAAPCTCFITADRNLATAAQARNIEAILLKHPRNHNLIEESIPKLIKCAALTGPAIIRVGPVKAEIMDPKPVKGDISMKTTLRNHGKLAEFIAKMTEIAAQVM